MRWITMLMLVLGSSLAMGQDSSSDLPAKVMGEAGLVRVVLMVDEFPLCADTLPRVHVTRDDMALGVKVLLAGKDRCDSWGSQELEIRVPGLPVGRYTVSSEVLQSANAEDLVVQSYEVLEATVGAAGEGEPGALLSAWTLDGDGVEMELGITWFDLAEDQGPPGQPGKIQLK